MLLFLNSVIFIFPTPHASDSTRVALVGIRHSCLENLHYFSGEEMRKVWVLITLPWVGGGCRKGPFYQEAHGRHQKASPDQKSWHLGRPCAQQDSMFLTPYWFVPFSIRKSFQIGSQDTWWELGSFHGPWARSCCQLAHVCHGLSICDCAFAPKSSASSQTGGTCGRDTQCSWAPRFTSQGPYERGSRSHLPGCLGSDIWASAKTRTESWTKVYLGKGDHVPGLPALF